MMKQLPPKKRIQILRKMLIKKNRKRLRNSKVMLKKRIMKKIRMRKNKLKSLKKRKARKMKIRKNLLPMIKKIMKTMIKRKRIQRKKMMSRIKKIIIDLFIKLTTLITCSPLIFVLLYGLPLTFHISLNMPFQTYDLVEF